MEILDAAWEVARQDSLAGLTLRQVADRVGMQPPSLYSHFASKNAIYDAMFEQAWRNLLEQVPSWIEQLPNPPRARLIKVAELYFDFAVADLARHQLMNVNIIPNFEPSPQAYAASLEAYSMMRTYLPLSDQDDIDIYTALVSGLGAQQLANDPGGQRWRRLIPRVMTMFADDLGLPRNEPSPPESS
ncbi:MAG TPA: TetR/AcrR family transcriptional regulator [Propionibacteriaceae bacterium]|nr:TetR/AcrR family transcriptional regulator [Propionibacteriaceae bacterium]